VGPSHDREDAPSNADLALHHIPRRLSGETEREFQTLLDFVSEMRFDRLGAFTFSFELGTQRAAGDPVRRKSRRSGGTG
jgi:hypothetical protein